MRGRFVLQHLVDPDRLVELAGIEIRRRQLVDVVERLVAALLVQVRGRAVDGIDLRVRQHDVFQRLGLELDAIFRAAFGVRDHFLELLDRALILAGVVIAPRELIDRERIQFRQLERSRLFECRPQWGICGKARSARNDRSGSDL